MVSVELNWSTGSLRQPGTWGKVINPQFWALHQMASDPGAKMSVRGAMTIFRFSSLAEGTWLLLGMSGYSKGVIVECYVLLRVKPDSTCDWASPQYQATINSTGAELVAQSENNLAPIYAALTQGNYSHLANLQDVLRQQGIDKAPAR